MLEPGFAQAMDFNAPGNINNLMAKYIENKQAETDENDGSAPNYCFVFNEDENCPNVPWGLRDNEPFLYKTETMYSGQARAIVQRLANMMTKQGVWHEVVLPQGFSVDEIEKKKIDETILKLNEYRRGIRNRVKKFVEIRFSRIGDDVVPVFYCMT